MSGAVSRSERLELVVAQGCVEVVGYDEASAVESELPRPPGRHEAGDLPAAGGDDDLLAGTHLLQEPRQVGLGLVDPDGLVM